MQSDLSPVAKSQSTATLANVDLFEGFGKIGDEERWCQFVFRVYSDRSVTGTIKATGSNEWRNVETHCVTSGYVRRIHAPGDYEVGFLAVTVDPTLKDKEVMYCIARLTPTSMTASYKYAISGREYDVNFFRTGKSFWQERIDQSCSLLEPGKYRVRGYCVTSRLMAKCVLFLSLEVTLGGSLSGATLEYAHQSQVVCFAVTGTWKRDRMEFTAKNQAFECTYTAIAWPFGLRGSWLSEVCQSDSVQFESGEFELMLCDRSAWCEGLLAN